MTCWTGLTRVTLCFKKVSRKQAEPSIAKLMGILLLFYQRVCVSLSVRLLAVVIKLMALVTQCNVH
ncbi:Serine/threonine-protein kinase AFC3 [Zea mays]|uniref:Serine/threonine-protein kinase AFC3 n=1 Tax=Zea mays TaxID=4577 RepID=A0A1D6NL17_MAIZE|nr:Serine/threonine-protein kinase AFC3 [Zea mays]